MLYVVPATTGTVAVIRPPWPPRITPEEPPPPPRISTVHELTPAGTVYVCTPPV